MACPAEDGLSVAHWHIKGLTKRGQKPFVTKGNRRTMTVAVFIKYGHRPVVVVLPPRPKQGGKSAAEANVDSFIMSLPGRNAKCLESGGQHFE